MKKYLSGGWTVLKNYLFAMFFFYIFIVGFYTKAGLFSIVIFIVMVSLTYYELCHRASFDKRNYGTIRLLDGLLYGLIAIAPFVLIQVLVYQLNLNISGIKFDVLKWYIIKGFLAPMFFIIKYIANNVWGYVIAWSSLVIVAFLGYYSGYRSFDLGTFTRQKLGLQPRKRNARKKG